MHASDVKSRRDSRFDKFSIYEESISQLPTNPQGSRLYFTGRQETSSQMGAAPNTLLPKQLTTINKHYQAEAVIGLKEVEPRPVRALQYFCNRVQQLCCKHRLQIDFINISTIFTAVAQLWDKAQANQEFHLDQPKTNRKLVAFLRSVFTLVPMPGKVGSQAISNISWASAKLGIDLYTFEPGLTCKLVADFVKSIQASKANNRPNAQGSANFFWALGVWQHLPSDAAFSIMWAHSVALFEDAEQPLKPQDSSNFLYACAQLGLAVTEKDAHILLNSMLNQGRGSPTVQDYGNTAWSLAVLGRLHVESLQALLNQVFHLQETMQHASNCFTDANLRQMYQALYALQPPLDAPCEQQERWEQLQRSLSKLGPCPPWHWSTGKEQLTAALSKMDVCYEVDVLLSAYMAAAVIWPCVRHAPAVIVTINLEEFDYIKNRVNRLSGPALFRHALLAKHGQLVMLPEDKLRLSGEELAAYLREQVEVVTGRSLHEYRKTAY